MVRQFHNGGKLLSSGSLAIVLASVVAGVVPLLKMAGGDFGFHPSPYLLHVALFTLGQALLSTLLSLCLGLAAARALSGPDFPGRLWFLRLLILPQALPSIVVALALLSLWGANGVFAHQIPIYGLTGIVMAHTLFNAPLATRLLLTGLEAVPSDLYRLGAQLRFSDWDILTRIEWPALRGSLKNAAVLIFLLCMTSFSIILTLGGGPAATTIEVAIYQALKMDFDPGFAASLAMVQLVICTIVLSISGFTITEPPPLSMARGQSNFFALGLFRRLMDGVSLALLALLILPLVLAILASGLSALSHSPLLMRALATSLCLGATSACFSVSLGGALVFGQLRARLKAEALAFSLAPLLALIVPPAVIATGWFILLVGTDHTGLQISALITALNGLAALPFVAAPLRQTLSQSFTRYDRLCESLGVEGLNRLRLVELPLILKPLALAALLAFSLSLGDLAAISLFGNGDLITLPSLIYQQMGHYKMHDAAGTALVLALLSVVLSYTASKLARQR